MVVFLFVLSYLHWTVLAADLFNCPEEKTVGGVCYSRVGLGVSTQQYGCQQDCTYTRTDEGGLYCFKAGNLPVTTKCVAGNNSEHFGDGDTDQDASRACSSLSECGSGIMKFVSSQVYTSAFAVQNIFVDYPIEYSSAGQASNNFWLTPDSFTGVAFVAQLFKPRKNHFFNGIRLRNVYNVCCDDRSTKSFTVSFGEFATGHWKEVLTQELEDSRSPGPARDVQEFYWNWDLGQGLGSSQNFVQFKLNSYYGLGGGLKYFDVITASVVEDSKLKLNTGREISPISSAEACSELCRKEPRCHYYQLEEDTCFLKFVGHQNATGISSGPKTE